MNNQEVSPNPINSIKAAWQGFNNQSSSTKKDISIFNFKSLLKQAWQDYKIRPFFYSLVSILIILLGWINYAYTEATKYSINPWLALLGLVIVFFFVQMFAGNFRMILKAINGEKPKFQDLLVGFMHIIRFLGVLLTAVLLGMLASIVVENYIVATWAQSHPMLYNLYLLLILVGLVYLIISLQFLFFAIVKHGFFTSFKISWQAIRGYRLKLIWFILVAIVFNLVGVAVLGIGLFVTLPLSFLAYARIYGQLQPDSEIKSSKLQSDIIS